MGLRPVAPCTRQATDLCAKGGSTIPEKVETFNQNPGAGGWRY